MCVAPVSSIWTTVRNTPMTPPKGGSSPLVKRLQAVEVPEQLVGAVDEMNDHASHRVKALTYRVLAPGASLGPVSPPNVSRLRSAESGELDDRSAPASRIVVLLVHRIHVDDDLFAIASDAEAIHAPGRTAGDELTVGLILRVMLRALEPMIGVVPSQCGMLVRAGQVERVDRILPAHEDHLLIAIDLRAVCRRNGIAELITDSRQRTRGAYLKVLGERAGRSCEAKRRRDSGDREGGIAQELSPARDRACATFFPGGTLLVLDYSIHASHQPEMR